MWRARQRIDSLAVHAQHAARIGETRPATTIRLARPTAALWYSLYSFCSFEPISDP